jgi:DNA-binding response OmpR family regulator
MKHKILVVDDSMLTRAIISKGLEEGGYAAIQAESSKAGLEAFTAHQPELVILDYHLPDFDGIELAKRIRAKSKSVPLILLSTDFGKEIKQASQKAGINDYLFKNFEKKELLKKVGALL